MNCRCAAALLSAYMDGELTGREMLLVRSHMDECEACRSELESLRSLKHLMAQMTCEEPRPGFEDALVAKVMNQVPAHRAPLFGTLRLAVAWSLAAALVVLVGLQWFGQPSSVANVAAERPAPFSVERDQAYLAGADPISGRAPVYSVSDVRR